MDDLTAQTHSQKLIQDKPMEVKASRKVDDGRSPARRAVFRIVFLCGPV
jgi:hypothetical protein